MTTHAIIAENLAKRYLLGRTLKPVYETLSGQIASMSRGLLRRKNAADVDNDMADELWALRDVSFSVERGQILGVVGKNGAGKSTLLKILARITAPTSGHVDLYGRVGSLLEIGVGFHPELSGLENVLLSGALLGMRRHEIRERTADIIEFAEVGRFAETPVKYYSSGMYMRLAFSVAAHLNPEILLVDEVLAVGDVAFQRKCLGKMGEIVHAGRTIVFVSHNLGAVQRLCSRVLWIDGGAIRRDGAAAATIAEYEATVLAGNTRWSRDVDREDTDVWIRSIEVLGSEALAASAPVTVAIGYQVARAISGCQIGVRISAGDGTPVLTTADTDIEGISAKPRSPGLYRARFEIPGGMLAPGAYSVLVAAHLPQRTHYDVVENAVSFNISSADSLVSLDGRLGVVAPLIAWQTERA